MDFPPINNTSPEDEKIAQHNFLGPVNEYLKTHQKRYPDRKFGFGFSKKKYSTSELPNIFNKSHKSLSYSQKSRPRSSGSVEESPKRKSSPVKKKRTKRHGSRNLGLDPSFYKPSSELQTWERRQEEWKQIQKKLAKKTGKSMSDLIMSKSTNDHRRKLEEIDILESSIPMSYRFTPKSWELSLRQSGHGKFKEVIMVKVGSDWPYPLYCPAKLHSGKKHVETIRQTVKNTDPEIDRKGRKSRRSGRKSAKKRKDQMKGKIKRSLGIRAIDSMYVKKKYSKFIKRKMIYDVEDEIDRLIVIGRSKPIIRISQEELNKLMLEAQQRKEEAYQLRTSINENLMDSLDKDATRGFENMNDLHLERLLMENERYNIDMNEEIELAKKTFNVEGTSGDVKSGFISEIIERYNGPSFRISKNNLSFTTTTDKINQKKIHIINDGTIALQYEWVRSNPVNNLQKKRSGTKFQIANPAKGVIYPGRRKSFFFIFQTQIEGIFTDAFIFNTIPEISKSDVKKKRKMNPLISLRAIVLNENKGFGERDIIHERDNEFEKVDEKELFVLEKQNEIKRQKMNEKRRRIMRERDKERLAKQKKKFQNENLHLNVILTNDLFINLKNYAKKILTKYQEIHGRRDKWDFSISMLRMMIHTFPKRDFKQYHDLIVQIEKSICSIDIQKHQIDSSNEKSSRKDKKGKRDKKEKKENKKEIIEKIPIIIKQNEIISLSRNMNITKCKIIIQNGIDEIIENIEFIRYKIYKKKQQKKKKEKGKKRESGKSVSTIGDGMEKNKMQFDREVRVNSQNIFTNMIDCVFECLEINKSI